MFKMKQWMKPISRMMVLNMFWLVWAVTPTVAEPVQTAFLINPENYSKAEDFHKMQSDTVSVESRENLAVGHNIQRAVPDEAQNYRRGEDRKFSEKNSVLGNVGNVGGFIITYSTVLVGYLVLYVPLGSYGAAKCVFDREGWNDCWNDYMNRTFH